MPEYLALLGDTSDNVPGVPGIGEKTALRLIGESHTLERLFDSLEAEPKSAVDKKLAAGKERAFQSRELIRLKLDLPVLGVPQKAPPNLEDAWALCKRLGLAKLMDKLKKLSERTLDFSGEASEIAITQEEKEEKKSATAEPETEPTEAQRAEEARVRSVEEAAAQNVDFEALLDADELAIFLSGSGGAELQLADAHGHYSLVQGLELGDDFGARLTGKKLFVNDYKELAATLGPRQFESCEIWDLKTAHYLLHPDNPSHELKDLYSQETLEIPAFALWRATRDLNGEIRRHEGLFELMERVDLPLIPVLVEMERGGIRLAPKAFVELQRELEERRAAIEQEIGAAAGEEINLNSPKQVAWLLFERLGLPSGAKTKGKTGFSTSASVLEGLAELDLPHAQVPRLMLEHRELSKMLSGFVVPLQKAANLGGGVVHTTFEAAFTGTGRLSSRDPNLQNLPAFGNWSRRIKEGLIPESPDRVFVAADYSQVELRILAHLSGEERLQDAFRKGGRDIHRETASWVFATPPEDVTPELRRVAKMINFGLLYGMSAFGLADRLSISRSEAKSIIARYFSALPGVERYLEESAAMAQTRGYTRTLFGRIRPIDEAMEGVRDRNGLKLIAANTPLQVTAADIARKAMIDFARRFAGDKEVRLFLQIHDSLVCECPEDREEEVGEALAQVMKSAASLAVPLDVELKTGRSLADA
jgi:DNA polymerase-1